MAEIKIPEPKYATTRKSIDTIMPPESRETIRDNKVVVRERRIGKDGKSGESGESGKSGKGSKGNNAKRG